MAASIECHICKIGFYKNAGLKVVTAVPRLPTGIRKELGRTRLKAPGEQSTGGIRHKHCVYPTLSLTTTFRGPILKIAREAWHVTLDRGYAVPDGREGLLHCRCGPLRHGLHLSRLPGGMRCQPSQRRNLNKAPESHDI